MRGNWTHSPRAPAGRGPRPSFDSLHHMLTEAEAEAKPRPGQPEAQVLVHVASGCVLLSCLVQAAVYVSIGAYMTSVFLFLAVLLSGLGMAYMYLFRQPRQAAVALCVEVCLCSLAVYWSSAGQSLNVLNWAMLAPLLLSLLGGPAVISVSLLLVSAITVCVFHALQGFLDPMDLTPEKVVLDYRWVVALSCLNALLPWLTAFATMALLLRQRRRAGGGGGGGHPLDGAAVDRVQVLARHLAELNLDSISSIDEAGDSSVVGLLKQVAATLQRVRPFLPAEVLQGTAPLSQSLATGTQSVALDAALLEAAQLTSASGVVDLASSGFERTAPSGPETCLTLGEHTTSDGPAHLLPATLLDVKLHDFANFAEEAGEGKVGLIPKVSRAFQEVVQRVAAEHQGVVREVGHDHALISWHSGTPQPYHALCACQAARAIAQQLRVVVGKRDPAAGRHSIGLWSGLLPIGAFDSDEVTQAGLLGRGVARVKALQHYAAVHGRGIVASAEVRLAVADSVALRLLPVDVAALQPRAALPVRPLDDPMDIPTAEILYEVLDSQPLREQEWMYEIHANAHTANVSDVLERLLRQLQCGPPYTAAFEEDLRRVTGSEDRAVRRVAEHVQAVAERAAAAYCTQLVHVWCPTPLDPREGPRPGSRPPRPVRGKPPVLHASGPSPGDPGGSSSSSSSAAPRPPPVNPLLAGAVMARAFSAR